LTPGAVLRNGKVVAAAVRDGETRITVIAPDLPVTPPAETPAGDLTRPPPVA
jgi:hypothetical protein